MLIATEAAGEGINLQFCWFMINYDIPWNPMRLEQRMGRIHRYGQERDCVIFNFAAINTREGRVLQKLLERLREIRRELGTDQVFDVVGEVLPSYLLEKLFRDLYTHKINVPSPKDEECIVDEVKGKDKSFFERSMAKAMSEGRRIITPSGIGIVVFAHKTTTGWEAQLQAMVDAGWVITSSWPIDTEMGSRLRAMDSAALASSIHLVCRPRENQDGSIKANDIGDWRDILHELPNRIHEWMPRLAKEGIVGADAIFACLGPALEIFSRYSRVEKASGEEVKLKEYLEHVWAAVAKEALNMIFEGADTSGFKDKGTFRQG